MLCEQFYLFRYMIQISVEVNRRYNLQLSSTGDLHHASLPLFRAARRVKEWYHALRSIRILQSAGTCDDERYIEFVKVHSKHVNVDLFI